MKKLLFSLLSFLIIVSSVSAQKMPREDVVEVPAIGDGLCVHNLFQSNMVLQRNKPIVIHGWASPGEKVEVNFAGKTLNTVAADDRSWKVEFPAMKESSSPTKMTIKGKDETLTLENILIGDIWILGGQSNMEFPLTKVENGHLEIVSANFPEMRILTVPSVSSDKPLKGFERLHQWSDWSKRHYRKGDWDVCSPETVKELSAIGYVFARRIHMATRVPIGVIDISRGGTTVEAWTPRTALKKINSETVNAKIAEWDEKVAAFDPKLDLENRIKRHHQWVEKMKKQGKKIPADRKVPTNLKPGPRLDQNRPGNCYDGMLAPIAGLSVKGAIFHQGFNNALGGSCQNGQMYKDIFPLMISEWRKAFNDDQMPFGIISLCTAGSPQNRDNVLENMANLGPYIREAQYKTFEELYKAGDKNIGFTSSFDLRRSWYHPQLKLPAGERMARWALATQYGFERDIHWKPPMITKMEVQEGKLILHLDSNVKAPDDSSIKGFVIAGNDQKFQPADVEYFADGKDSRGRPKYKSSILVLSSKYVQEPKHFRYAWARNPDANLQLDGNKDIPFATQRSDSWLMEDARSLRGEYKKQDLERKIKEAQDFLDQNKAKL